MARKFPIIVALALVGCQPGSGPAGAPPDPVAALSGQVIFPAWNVQATLDEVAVAATVSLINADTNRTEATTLTNNAGAFRLTFPLTFRPSATDSFYLEAVKGLGSNRAGNSAARVRTLARFVQGWTTLSNASPEGFIHLNTATTALCIAASLRGGTATAVEFASLIGTYDSPTQTYTPVTNLSGADFTTLKALADQILLENQDPLAGITLTEPSLWSRKNLSGLTLARLDPASGSIGTSVTLIGSGFDPTVASNSVRFNGVLANVSGVTPTTLTVAVPAGATPGPVTVQVGAFAATGPTFTVTSLVYGGVVAQP